MHVATRHVVRTCFLHLSVCLSHSHPHSHPHAHIYLHASTRTHAHNGPRRCFGGRGFPATHARAHTHAHTGRRCCFGGRSWRRCCRMPCCNGPRPGCVNSARPRAAARGPPAPEEPAAAVPTHAVLQTRFRPDRAASAPRHGLNPLQAHTRNLAHFPDHFRVGNRPLSATGVNTRIRSRFPMGMDQAVRPRNCARPPRLLATLSKQRTTARPSNAPCPA